MGQSQRLRARRNFLFAKLGGKCEYCGHEMVLPENAPRKNYPWTATIDHTKDRLDPTRKDGGKWVLACWRCNQVRSNARAKQLPIEEQWRRSGAYPQGHPLATDHTTRWTKPPRADRTQEKDAR